MKRFGFLSTQLLLLLLAVTLLISGCGNSRQLKSVAISPASADAKSFPNGQVSFAATGTFSKSPSPAQLTSKDVLWCAGTSSGVCVGNINPGITIDQNGVGQCNSGFVGTAIVLAGTAASASMNPDGGSQLKVFGSAQLTCP